MGQEQLLVWKNHGGEKHQGTLGQAQRSQVARVGSANLGMEGKRGWKERVILEPSSALPGTLTFILKAVGSC